ncbi:MAG TPA: chromate transporter [Bacteroidota bacterium]
MTLQFKTTGTVNETASYSLPKLLSYFLKLGTIGFGGPIALIGYMEHDLVEERGWLTKDQYLRGLALSQLAPGPLAAQLAMYTGYVKNGFVGATCTGIVFVLPSFIMVVLLGLLYKIYGGLAWMQAVFYGVGAAVIGIIAKSAYKLTKLTLKSDALLWGIFIVMWAVTAYTEQEIAWLFVLCGFVPLLRLAPPKWLNRGLQLLVPSSGTAILPLSDSTLAPSFGTIFLFFAKAGAFVFGSGLAVVPFLYGSTVEQYHWLNQRQFLDAVAVAMITPGPVVITVGFIGYLVGNLPGAIAAALGVFLPVYLVVVFLTPYYERFAQNSYVHAFVQGVTSAATGAIAGAVIVLGRRAIVDAPTALIALGALGAVLRTKVPDPVIVFLAGVIGLLLSHFH